jgi:DNA-3-methyladenine glycosylase II
MDTRSKAFQHFLKVDKRFHKAVLPHKGLVPAELPAKRTRADLFAALASTVISQQLGTGAATTIRERVKKVCGGRLTPESILNASPLKMRAAGLSGSKLKTLQSLAQAVKAKKIDLLKLKDMPEEEAKSRLTEIWGIGPWSAEMFLLFSLGRPDVFSAGDLGLARSIEAIYGLPKNAPRDHLMAIADAWAPYRSFASLLLWRARDAK